MTDEFEAVYALITALCKAGDAQAQAGAYDFALKKYREALALLPEPREKWDAATWILAAMGDAVFAKADSPAARDALQQAMHCPGALGNPFLHLRLGQAQLELKNIERAKDELARAYMGGGDEIFQRRRPQVPQLHQGGSQASGRSLNPLASSGLQLTTSECTV